MNTKVDSLAEKQAQYHQDHCTCHSNLSEHMQDTSIHTNEEERDYRKEWRTDTTARLTKLEALLMDIKHNGTARGRV